MRQETKYNKVVNIAEDGEITVLDYTFSVSQTLQFADGTEETTVVMKGATGNSFYPVSKSEYDEKTNPENVINSLAFSRMELPQAYKRIGFAGMVEQMSSDEIEELIFDTSYRELWDYMREVAELDEESAYIFECVGGGRMFDENYQGNINPELSAIIREYESK